MQQTHLVLAAAVTVLALALVGAVAFGPAVAESDGETPQSTPTVDSTIDVTAVGEVTAVPDEGVIQVTLAVEGDDIDAVNDQLAADAEALRTALDEVGVSYETTDYRVGEVRFRDDDDPAYEGHHSFEVTTDDTDQVGPAIDAAAGAGATIDSVEMTLSEEQSATLTEQAIDAAMADARSQAATIADAENLEIINAASVDATQRRYSPVTFETALDAGDEAGTEIDVDEVAISYDVAVTYNATAT